MLKFKQGVAIEALIRRLLRKIIPKMTKKFLIMLALVALCAFSASALLPLDKYTISRKELPAEAQEMLSEHFPKAKVSMIKVDRHLLKKTDYDVRLTNGARIGFSNKGAWTSVEVKKGSVPEALIHKTIRRHLDKNFKGLDVRRIEKKISGYIICLSDESEHRYDLLGIYKGVKDKESEESED